MNYTEDFKPELDRLSLEVAEGNLNAAMWTAEGISKHAWIRLYKQPDPQFRQLDIEYDNPTP